MEINAVKADAAADVKMNTFGTHIRFTSFGESHGPAVGGVIDGFPAGRTIGMDFVRQQVQQRQPQADFSTPRHESDQITWLSGLKFIDDTSAITLGTPIAFYISNNDVRPLDYTTTPRPGHADMTYLLKYGIQPTGGGRASARETITRVVAGAMCEQLLQEKGIRIFAYTHAIGNIKADDNYNHLNLTTIYDNATRCPDADTDSKMLQLLTQIKAQKDSIGGIVKIIVKGMPAGVGEPIFHRLPALLAHAILTINACKGFDYGSGFEAVEKTGSELNDPILPDWQTMPLQAPHTMTNNAGGCLGGITTGNDIVCRAVFKPTPTIGGEGRHDVCVVPRAVSVVKAMTALTLADVLL